MARTGAIIGAVGAGFISIGALSAAEGFLPPPDAGLTTKEVRACEPYVAQQAGIWVVAGEVDAKCLTFVPYFDAGDTADIHDPESKVFIPTVDQFRARTTEARHKVVADELQYRHLLFLVASGAVTVIGGIAGSAYENRQSGVPIRPATRILDRNARRPKIN